MLVLGKKIEKEKHSQDVSLMKHPSNCTPYLCISLRQTFMKLTKAQAIHKLDTND